MKKLVMSFGFIGLAVVAFNIFGETNPNNGYHEGLATLTEFAVKLYYFL